ncbi:MAG: TetR/AcrR family transcriptional regulator [Verrucomicrobiota bacterium]|nr:TetR/AcrR family transcriptional regulator [Verrucomicrobiota bacterium]
MTITETRQRILNTAAALFSERGYELVGINELIEKSDVAKATFYQHFRSKEKLCAEWLRQESREMCDSGKALLASPVPPEEKVAMKFDGLRDYLKGSDFRGCPFSNTATVVLADNEVREVVRGFKASVRQFWHELAGEIRPDAAEAARLGDELFLLFSGAVTEAQNLKEIWPVETAKSAGLTLCTRKTNT